MAEFFRSIGIASLAWLIAGWAIVVGSLFYASASALLIPRSTRTVARFVLLGPFRAGAIFKVLSYGIHASGLLLSVLICEWVFGELESTADCVTICCVTVLCLMSKMHELVFLEFPDTDRTFRSTAPALQAITGQNFRLGKIDRLRLAQMQIADILFPRIFAVLIELGVLAYFLFQLGVIPSAERSPTLAGSVLVSLSLGGLFPEADPMYTGSIWKGLSAVGTVYVYYWAVIFIAYALATPNESRGRDAEATHADTGSLDANVSPAPEPVPAADLLATMTDTGSLTTPDARGVVVAALLPQPAAAAVVGESACLVNVGPETIDLTGWKLVGRGGVAPLAGGELAPGGALCVPMQGTGVRLGNRGGWIALCNESGIVVDRASYASGEVTPGVIVARSSWSPEVDEPDGAID